MLFPDEVRINVSNRDSIRASLKSVRRVRITLFYSCAETDAEVVTEVGGTAAAEP